MTSRDKSKGPPTEAIAIVDPVSTGANVALEAQLRGYAVVALWTLDLPSSFRSHVPMSVAPHLKFVAECEEQPTVDETVKLLRKTCGKLELVAVICGCESGVKYADTISEALGLRTNGTKQSDARRNKKLQQEAVKASGLRSTREAGGKRWEEVAHFVETEPMPVIVKPVESAGSDGVKLCRTAEEAEQHFNQLVGEQRKFGAQGAGILVQEFLVGKEYVIDSVSRDGVHKCCMVWLYDKRPLNGAPFVYFNMLPVADQAIVDVLVPYTFGVLDAIGIRNGPSHGEVMLGSHGPCLVEMNCRTHGGDGAWVPLARGLTGGYSQVDVTLAAFTKSSAEFDKLSVRPPHPFRAAGQEVLLVSTEEGRVVASPGLESVQQLASFISLESGVHVGSVVERTIDVFTQAGSVILCHHDAAVVERDVARIREMEAQGRMFVLEQHTAFLSPPPSVVRGRATSGSASDLRRQYEEINEAKLLGGAARLQRTRRHTSSSKATVALEGLRQVMREATGYHSAAQSDDGADAYPRSGTRRLSERRGSRKPQAAPSWQSHSLLTSAVLLGLGFALGLGAAALRGRKH